MGWSVPFTIDSAYKAKVLQVEFDYIVNSGTFVAGSSSAESDVIVYLYDVTNSTLIEPSSIKLLSNSSTISDKYISNFQTSATGTSYRLILHCQSTSALDYELKLDNVAVKPCNYVYGTPITDMVSYTPTFTGFGTAGSINMRSRKVGNFLHVQGYFQAGTPTAVTAQMTLGYAGANGNVVVDSAIAGLVPIGSANVQNSSFYGISVLTQNPVAVNAINFGTSSGSTNPFTAVLATNLVGAGNFISVDFMVPITGWSSSVQMSDSYDGRLISVVASNPTSSLTSSFTDIATWGTVTQDTTNSFVAATGVFTAPSSGTYRFSGSLLYAGVFSTADKSGDVKLVVNGSDVRQLNVRAAINNTNIGLPFSFEYPMTAGQTAKLQGTCNGTGLSYNGGGAFNSLTISKLQAPTTISATETIAAGYSLSANKTPAANAAIDFDTKLYDTHNAVTTGGSGVWKFTAPASGIYEVNMTGALTSGAQTIDLYKNGVQGKALMSVGTSVTSGSASVLLNAGDYISANPDGSVTFSSTKNTNIYIKRLK